MPPCRMHAVNTSALSPEMWIPTTKPEMCLQAAERDLSKSVDFSNYKVIINQGLRPVIAAPT